MWNLSRLQREIEAASLPLASLFQGELNWTRELTPEEELVIASILENHDPYTFDNLLVIIQNKDTDPKAMVYYNAYLEMQAAQKSAVVDYGALPDWLKEWTPQETAEYVHDNVLNGLDSLGVDAYVDGLPNTVAGMKTGLKQIGGALVAIRDILEIIAKLLMYIRDLVIRFRSS